MSRKKWRKKRCVQLRERDGDLCFYCWRPMRFVFELVGGCSWAAPNVSIEHLVERSQGGGSEIENLTLAHGRCNSSLAGMTKAAKLVVRERNRPLQCEAA